MLYPVNLLSLEDDPPPPRRFIAGDLFPVGAVSSLYGDGGTGKTMAMLDLMLATAAAHLPTDLAQNLVSLQLDRRRPYTILRSIFNDGGHFVGLEVAS